MKTQGSALEVSGNPASPDESFNQRTDFLQGEVQWTVGLSLARPEDCVGPAGRWQSDPRWANLGQDSLAGSESFYHRVSGDGFACSAPVKLISSGSTPVRPSLRQAGVS